MRPSITIPLLILLATLPKLRAQPRPDFSGVWVLDADRSDPNPYGQLRVVAQKDSEITFSAVQYSGPPSTSGLHVIPWTLPFDRWRPRRGGETSREPKVKAAWDGQKLIYVKAPGESYSVLFLWTLVTPDEFLVESVNWHGIPFSFDFREKSISSAYIRTKHLYRRASGPVSWSPQPDGKPVIARLTADRLTVTCKSAQCRSFDIVAGRRGTTQSYGDGRAFTVPLDRQTTIEFPGAP